ncbi:hypothetical protein FOL85_03620 [Lactobacillus reuteri]|uniref:hypothetical protein n=1 Tax=Limosilactobacillus reuteri TaxID=1598 RepID=UPI00146B44E9|nr:hypothetical protein [Limosilactobacillus reuteri]NMV51602.1 hypothetical protein [Limosilactobacillus reuteri]NMV55799.1 hypothetical protein [Limosilactobacillus reuteri]NMV64779.1 hypothetical protein [Limosilactobacillus reuteri]
MADLTQIVSGMEQGPEKIMDNFNKVNDDNGKIVSMIADINWSNSSTEGIVYNSNFEYVTGGYSTVSIGGLRLVHLNIAIQLKNDFKNNGTGAAFALPQSINMGQNFGVAGDHATWACHDGMNIQLQPSSNAVEDWKQGDSFNINVIY